ncbi:MAG: malto-oligosyltrehalose synthase [Candidatus Omnitrophica bacterium]|nr:malto-oligosyltrehalose synthase [Candidatus Omnitrophota bacterium]MBU4478649.1 malto-oligosyltrehalose synthase [Candidatus Omnitrophota bacterium]
MHIPISTYRIQLNPSFGFKETKDILSYLNLLGISDVYASPILKAKTGSRHGYDMVDPNRINPELGGEKEFEKLSRELKENKMFWLQDIVPNHMAYDKDNLMLMDIFEQRDRSPFFNYFDIDWVHPFESFKGRVLAPFLGGFYSEILENKEVKIDFNENGLSVKYYGLKFPLLLTTYKDVLLYNFNSLEAKLGAGSSLLIKFLGSVDIFTRVSKTHNEQHYNQVKHAKKMLWQFYSDNADIKSFVDGNIAFLNGDGENLHALDELDKLLSKQCYRLSFWKVASEELNYRRFFTINELISLRVEKKDVFDYTHKLILRLIQEEKIHGLRIDHIDGLYDPATYLSNLRNEAKDTYIVVEKILGSRENLPSVLPIQGTTGYDFMNYVNRLFCVKENEGQLTKIYFKFANLTTSYERLIQDKKRLIIGKHMAGDIDNLAQLMKKVAGHHRFGRDITLYGLKRALVEVVTFFSVYRTYINHSNFEESDKNYINEAIEKAHRNAPGLEYEIDFIKKFLLLELVENFIEEEKKEFWQFIMKFQQLTAPIMAKGFEDTVFYTFNKLLSLNEVGGDPALPGIEPKDFFEFLRNRSSRTPHSFNATATHDTKRGEDVRARINVLSEMPDIWKTYLEQWAKINKTKKQKNGDEHMPDANDEYFIYQTLLGSFPFAMDEFDSYKKRIKDYVIKAVREAKVHTAWIKPDHKYEEACISFVEKLLDQDKENKFFQSFQELRSRVSHYGICNSLSQALIKMTAPGVTDFYQGTELWDLSLVDPDNRRPVDYGIRMKYLKFIQEGIAHDIPALVDELLKTKDDGRIKLFLIYQILQLRKKHEDLFLRGDFVPLNIEGEHSKSVIAYARKLNNSWAITVAPRFLTKIIKETEFPLGKEMWKDTYIQLTDLMPGNVVDAITLRRLQCQNKVFIGEVLSHFPVALLLNLSES